MTISLPNTIYCDEAGYTGNNLISLQQPYFVYSAVAIDPGEADEIVKKVIRDYRQKGTELKGRRMLRRDRGKRAIQYILEHFATQVKIAVYDKLYSLSGKFYEYVFDPVLAPKSSIFYELRFHRFVSNVLYSHFDNQIKYSEKVIVDFQNTMRAKEFERLDEVLSISSKSVEMAPFLRKILTFTVYHKDSIVEELTFLKEKDGIGNWVLDLSTTALFNLLAEWGQHLNGMEVYCDQSQPIATQGDFLEVMINREDRNFIDMEGKKHPITFNLTQPIQMVDSSQYPGVQIADVFASAVCYAMRYENEKFSQKCLKLLFSNDAICDRFSVFPDLGYTDTTEYYGYVNSRILDLLVGKSLKGINVLFGVEAEIQELVSSYPRYLLARAKD